MTAKSDDLPEGDLALAYERLCDRYAAKDEITKLTLKSEWDTCKMPSGSSNPDDWFTELDNLRMRLKSVYQARGLS